jgi:hypothetical protein
MAAHHVPAGPTGKVPPYGLAVGDGAISFGS